MRITWEMGLWRIILLRLIEVERPVDSSTVWDSALHERIKWGGATSIVSSVWLHAMWPTASHTFCPSFSAVMESTLNCVFYYTIEKQLRQGPQQRKRPKPSFSAMQGCSKKITNCKLSKKALTKWGSLCCLDAYFYNLRFVGSKFLLFRPPGMSYFCWSSSYWLMHLLVFCNLLTSLNLKEEGLFCSCFETTSIRVGKEWW